MLELENVNNSPPSASENMDIDEFINILGKLESVSREVQKEYTTMGIVRVLFDETITDFPQFEIRLSNCADVIMCKGF